MLCDRFRQENGRPHALFEMRIFKYLLCNRQIDMSGFMSNHVSQCIFIKLFKNIYPLPKKNCNRCKFGKTSNRVDSELI